MKSLCIDSGYDKQLKSVYDTFRSHLANALVNNNPANINLAALALLTDVELSEYKLGFVTRTQITNVLKEHGLRLGMTENEINGVLISQDINLNGQSLSDPPLDVREGEKPKPLSVTTYNTKRLQSTEHVTATLFSEETLTMVFENTGIDSAQKHAKIMAEAIKEDPNITNMFKSMVFKTFETASIEGKKTPQNMDKDNSTQNSL